MGWPDSNPNGLPAYLGWANKPEFYSSYHFFSPTLQKCGPKWVGPSGSAHFPTSTLNPVLAMYCFSLPKINKSRFEEAASELGVVKHEEIEEKTKIKKLMEEKGLLLVELVNDPA